MEALRTDCGFRIEVPCHNGALVDLQVIDDEPKWELCIAKGSQGDVDDLSVADLRLIAHGVNKLAEAIERSAR